MNEPLMFWKDRLVPQTEAVVSAFSPAAAYGLNVFETIRAYWSAHAQKHVLLHSDEHLCRLLSSAKVLELRHGVDQDSLKRALTALVAAMPVSDCVIRLMLTADAEPSESWSTDALMTLAIRYFESTSALDTPRTVTGWVTSWVRPESNSMPLAVKCGANYTSARYGFLQARAAGADLPVFLDSKGNVLESSGANIVARKGPRVMFCPDSMPILRGITQSFFKEQLKANRLFEVVERPFTAPDLYDADEIVLVGTSVEVCRMTSIDSREVGRSEENPLQESLTKILRQHVGR